MNHPLKVVNVVKMKEPWSTSKPKAMENNVPHLLPDPQGLEECGARELCTVKDIQEIQQISLIELNSCSFEVTGDLLIGHWDSGV